MCACTTVCVVETCAGAWQFANVKPGALALTYLKQVEEGTRERGWYDETMSVSYEGARATKAATLLFAQDYNALPFYAKQPRDEDGRQ